MRAILIVTLILQSPFRASPSNRNSSFDRAGIDACGLHFECLQSSPTFVGALVAKG